MIKMFRVLGLVLLVIGITFFWIGWHNIDLAVNAWRFCWFENVDCSKYVDETALGIRRSYPDLYKSGTCTMMASLIPVIAGTALLFKE